MQISLVIISLYFLCYQISRPLGDYDEATYAKVVVDTIHSGDISTFTLSGQRWFEKPPLYLWSAIASVALFGDHEFAYRLPAVFLGALCLWLVYALVKELLDDDLTASIAFLILLFSELFLIFAREARTDQGMIVGILAALFFLIKGWKNDRYLFWIFPAIAVGFLFKSVVVFLAIPVIIIYSLFYQQWNWIKSSSVWKGLLLALVIIAPWHLYETIRFGWAFWNSYVGVQVFQRATTTLTGTNQYYDYARFFLLYYKPWDLIVIVGTPFIFLLCISKQLRAKIFVRTLIAPLSAAVMIVLAFTLAQTHLPTYIMPAFPFLAMYVALAFKYLLRLLNAKYSKLFVIILAMLLVLPYSFNGMAGALDQVLPATYDEQAIGHIYASNPSGTLYSAGWPILETLNYYGKTSVSYLATSSASGKLLRAPVYFVAGADMSSPGFKVLYKGNTLSLLYSDADVQLPTY